MIDYEFVHKSQTYTTVGYMESGVAIGINFDMSDYYPSEIEHIYSEDLAVKLMPYAKLAGTRAVDFLTDNPLTITLTEAREITEWVDAYYLNMLANSWNHSSADISFNELTDEQQTVLASLVDQYKYLSTNTPELWRLATNEDWTAAIAKLRNFTDVDTQTKRDDEANILENGFPLP